MQTAFFFFLAFLLFDLWALSKFKNKPPFAFGLLPLAGLGLAVWYLTRKAKALKQITFSVGIPLDIRYRDGNLIGTLPITFVNGSPQKTGFKNLYIPVYYQGDFIGEVKYPSAVTIAANGQTIVKTAFSANVMSVGSILISQLLSGTGKLEPFNLKGNVNFSGVNVYIDEAVTVPFPSFLKK